jgi:charged multivesicular body protein 2A
VQRILMEFEKQSQVMDIKEEMMNDAMEETVLEGDEETET